MYQMQKELTKLEEENERLANDLKNSQVELGESCAKNKTLTALNTELLKQLKDARNKVSDTCDFCKTYQEQHNEVVRLGRELNAKKR